jgi:hypothetical protein
VALGYGGKRASEPLKLRRGHRSQLAAQALRELLDPDRNDWDELVAAIAR